MTSVVRLVGGHTLLLISSIAIGLFRLPFLGDEKLLIVLVSNLIWLLHHRLTLVQTATLVILHRLLTLVLDDNSRVLILNTLRLVLVSKIATKAIADGFTMSNMLAILPDLSTFALLIIDKNLFLLAHLVVVAVILVLTVPFHVIVWQLGFCQIHLWTKLGSLSELRVALSRHRASKGFAVLVIHEPLLSCALTQVYANFLRIFVIIKRCHILFGIFVGVRLARLDNRITLRRKSSIVRISILSISCFQSR